MSNCYVFPEEELTALADAVRLKTGTSDKMTVNGMTQAIGNISSSSVAIYGKTNAYDFGELTETGNIAMGCRLFSRYIGSNIKRLSNYAFEGSIINEFDFPLLESINDWAFSRCQNIVNVDLPSSVTHINSYVFSNCYNLISINLPSNLQNMGGYVFAFCHNLDNVVIPNSVNVMSGGVFQDCYNLKNVVLPNSLSTLYSNTFSNCINLVNIVIPDSVNNISYGVFYNCYNLKNVVLPNSLTTISYNLFYNCTNMENIVLPDSVNNMGRNTFYNCYNLVNVKLSNSLTNIPNSTFMRCYNLRNIVIPNLVTVIENYAFGWCNNLDNVAIPNSVVNMNSNCFDSCSNLHNVIFEGTPSMIATSSFNNCRSLTDIYVPWSSGAVSGAPWGATNATIHYDMTYNQNPTAISVEDGFVLNESGNTFQINVIYTPNERFIDPTKLGVTYAITTGSEYASVDQNGLVTLTDDMTVGDTVVIAVTSIYDSTITATCTITAVDAIFNIDLNNGQWVDSGTAVDDHVVYKSDAGSYNINNGLSRMKVNFIGYDSVTVYIRSYAESGCDYTELGDLDVDNLARNGGILSTRNTQSATQYYSYTFSNLNKEAHSFEVIYSKDGSSHNGDDRGYVYFVPVKKEEVTT